MNPLIQLKKATSVFLVAFGLACFGLLPAVQAVLPSPTPDPCENPQTVAEQRDCVGRDYKQADEELNKVYGQLMSTLDDEGHKVALRTAQEAWIKYRDAKCVFESYPNRGGTLEPVVRYSCMADMTRSRTNELKEDVKNLAHKQ